MAPKAKDNSTDELEVTPAMIAAGVAAIESFMLEGRLLDSHLRYAAREAYLAMYKEAKRQKLFR